MEALYTILVALHILSWLGALALIDPRGTVRNGASHAIATALVTGLILVGLGESVDALDKDYNHVKIGIKLVVALVVVALTEVSNARGRRGTAVAGLVHAAGVLAVVNVLVAALWR